MLEFLSSVLNFLSFDLGALACVVAVSPFFANFVIFMIEFLLSVLSKYRRDGVYYLCFSLVGLTVSAYFCIQDFLGEKGLFISANIVYAFLSVYVCFILLSYSLVRKLSSKKEVVKSERKVELEEIPLAPSKAIDYFKKPDIEHGYLDIGYVKELIRELKTKPLSDSDYREIEELEVYLLRFITRQPEGYERKILSEKLSMLIKKLALYAV